MRLHHWSAAILLLALCAGRLDADDEELTTELILARWEKASAGHKSVDVTFDRLEISVFRQIPEAGRFYWEASGQANFSAGSERLVWSDEKLQVIDASQMRCVEYGRVELQAAKPAWEDFWRKYDKLSVWQRLSGLLMCHHVGVADPSDLIPLMVHVTADEIHRRYYVEWKCREDDVHVMLTPKDLGEANRYKRLDVLLDRKTWRTTAHRLVRNKTDETIFVFKHVEFDKQPEDRERLLNPDLTGFRIIKSQALTE